MRGGGKRGVLETRYELLFVLIGRGNERKEGSCKIWRGERVARVTDFFFFFFRSGLDASDGWGLKVGT